MVGDNRNNKVGFFISDVPLSLMKQFTKDIKTKHNDVYWVRLHELILKEQAYDAFVQVGFIPQTDDDVEEEIEDKPKIELFGN